MKNASSVNELAFFVFILIPSQLAKVATNQVVCLIQESV